MAPVTTLVAALIAASAALAVMVVDRTWSAREQRRAERRRIYAEFLGACWEAWGGHQFSEQVAAERMQGVAVRLAEVQLVAPEEVDDVATVLAEVLVRQVDLEEKLSEDFVCLYTAFVEAARRDVGVRR